MYIYKYAFTHLNIYIHILCAIDKNSRAMPTINLHAAHSLCVYIYMRIYLYICILICISINVYTHI